MCIYKRTIHGNPRYQSVSTLTFKTRSEAQAYENELTRWQQTRKFRVQTTGTSADDAITLSVLFEQYNTARTADPDLSQGTKDLDKLYARHIKNFFSPRDPIAATVTATEVENFCAHEVGTLELDPKWCNKVHRYWHRAYTFGQHRSLLSQSLPFYKLYSDTKHTKDAVYLTIQEIDKLLPHCRPDIRDIATVLAGTGLRRKNIHNIKCGDIDLERNQLTARNVKRGRKHMILPLLPEVRAVFVRRQVDQCPAEQTVFVFGDTLLRNQLHAAAKLAGIPVAKAHPHAFRHALGAQMARAGIAPEIRQKVLGHYRIQTTDHYSHLDDAGTTRDALEKTAAWRDIERAKKPKPAKVVEIPPADTNELSGTDS